MITIANAERVEDRWTFTSIDVIPTWVEPGSYRVLIARDANVGSYRRTMATLTSWDAPGVGEPTWSLNPGLGIH